MKKLILAAFATLALGVGAASAAQTDSQQQHRTAPQSFDYSATGG